MYVTPFNFLPLNFIYAMFVEHNHWHIEDNLRLGYYQKRSMSVLLSHIEEGRTGLTASVMSSPLFIKTVVRMLLCLKNISTIHTFRELQITVEFLKLHSTFLYIIFATLCLHCSLNNIKERL